MVKRLALSFIKGYQRYISPLTPGHCRFVPTCSEYCLQAVEQYGVVRGGWMGLIRILKCGPWHRGGFDPVSKEK